MSSTPQSVETRPFHGVWSPSLTPLNADLSPDPQRYIDHVRHLLATGCHGVSPFGTTGEATSFSVAERMMMLEALAKAGIAGTQMIPGTGCAALTDTVALSRHAVGLGCKAVMILPPFYYKSLSDEALFNSYAKVIEAVADERLRIILYHIPNVSMIPVTHGVITRLLAEFPGVIAGLKDSSGDWAGTRAFIDAFPTLDVFPGSELFLLEGLRHGAVGCITATANVNAARIRATYDGFVSGAPGLDALQDEITAYRKDLQSFPMIPAMKRMVAEATGLPEWAHTRPPFLDLTDAEWGKLKATR